MTDDQIKHLAERFLQWRLPANFNPDAGISFTPEFNVEWNAKRGLPPSRHEPTGTNLWGYTDAVEMVRWMVDGMPDLTRPAPADGRELRDALMIEVAYCRHAGLPVSETVDHILTALRGAQGWQHKPGCSLADIEPPFASCACFLPPAPEAGQ